MKKKGEIGISEIVGIILAIILLSFGIIFIEHINKKSQEVLENQVDYSISENERILIESRLETNDLVLSKTTFSLKKGQSEKLLVGVKNKGTVDSYFGIKIEADDPAIAELFLNYKKTPSKLKPKDIDVFIIMIRVPENSNIGDYFFNIGLTSDDEIINSKQILLEIE